MEILNNTNTSTIKKEFNQSNASMNDTIDSLDSSITTSNTNNKINNFHTTTTTNNNNYNTTNGGPFYNEEISQIKGNTNHKQNPRGNTKQISNSEIYSNEPKFVPKEPTSVPSAPIYSDSKISNKTYDEIGNLFFFIHILRNLALKHMRETNYTGFDFVRAKIGSFTVVLFKYLHIA